MRLKTCRQRIELPALQVESVEWLLDDLIPAGGLAILAGPPACGKTFLALDLAVGVATGSRTWGRDTFAGPVIYIDAENSPRLLAQRLRSLLDGRESMPPDALYFMAGQQLSLTKPDDITQLGTAMASTGARLVVFDSLVRFMGGADENDATAVASAIGGLRRLSNTHDCAILLLNHLRKSGGGSAIGTALESVRGSGDFVAAVDSVFIVRGTDGRGNITPAKSRWVETPPPFSFAITSDEGVTAITTGEATEVGKPKIERVIEAVLSVVKDSAPVTKREILSRVEAEGEKVSDRTLGKALGKLREAERIKVGKGGRAFIYELSQKEVQTMQLCKTL